MVGVDRLETNGDGVVVLASVCGCDDVVLVPPVSPPPLVPAVAMDDADVRLDRQADDPAGQDVTRVVLVTSTVVVTGVPAVVISGDCVVEIGTDAVWLIEVVDMGTTDGA